MKIESEKDLARICDILKAKGVKAFEVDGIRVEFLPVVESAPEAKALPDPEICRCGHGEYTHSNGLCVLCEPDKCVDPEKA